MVDTSFVILGAPENQTSPCISFDGTNYLVAWADSRQSHGIYCGRLTQSGTLLDSAGIPVSADPLAREPVAAFGDGVHLVVWEADSGLFKSVRAARVTPAGSVLDSGGFGLCAALGYKFATSVAALDSLWLVTWSDLRNGDADIYATRVTRSGRVLDLYGIPVSTAEGHQRVPCVASDGRAFLVVWQDLRTGEADVYGTRILPDGTVLDTQGIAISTARGMQYAPSAAFNGLDFVVAWEDRRLGGWDLFAARVTPDGVLLDSTGFVLSNALLFQSHISLACDGRDVLATWRDGRSGSYQDDIYAARISREGAVLESLGLVVSQADSEQTSPAVAFGRSDFLVVWDDAREYDDYRHEIYAARVSTSGTTLDTAGIPVSRAANAQREVAAGTDGDDFLVVWTKQVKEGDTDIWGTRVSADGTILDPVGFKVCDAASFQFSPSVAFSGTDYLVVWHDKRDPVNGRIYGARVNRQGEVLDPNGFLIPPDITGWTHGAAVVAGDSNYLVGFTRTVGLWSDVMAARVAPTGEVLDPCGFPVCTEAHHLSLGSVVGYDGSNYLVAWLDQRRLDDGDVYAARVTPDGIVLDPDGFVVNADVGGQGPCAISSDGCGWLVVHEDAPGRQDIRGVRLTPDGIVIDTQAIRLWPCRQHQHSATAWCDSAGYVVAWENYVNGDGADIYGVRLSPAGVVTDSIVMVSTAGVQSDPALAGGRNGDLLLAYTSWTGTEQHKHYNSYRTWARISPLAGVEEFSPLPLRPAALTCWPSPFRDRVSISCSPARPGPLTLTVFDATGRAVRSLRPGAPDRGTWTTSWNRTDDLGRRVPAGVYYLQMSQTMTAARTVVIVLD